MWLLQNILLFIIKTLSYSNWIDIYIYLFILGFLLTFLVLIVSQMLGFFPKSLKWINLFIKYIHLTNITVFIVAFLLILTILYLDNITLSCKVDINNSNFFNPVPSSSMAGLYLINSPLEISEQELSLLFEILDNTFYLTLICLFINYIVLLQSVLKYLSHFKMDWILKLPLPSWLCTKVFNLITKLIPYWQKSSQMIVFFGLIVLFIFLGFNSYFLYYISTTFHGIFQL